MFRFALGAIGALFSAVSCNAGTFQLPAGTPDSSGNQFVHGSFDVVGDQSTNIIATPFIVLTGASIGPDILDPPFSGWNLRFTFNQLFGTAGCAYNQAGSLCGRAIRPPGGGSTVPLGDFWGWSIQYSGFMVTEGDVGPYTLSLFITLPDGYSIANLTSDMMETPLPPSLPLFVAGLGLFHLLARRRSRTSPDEKGAT